MLRGADHPTVLLFQDAPQRADRLAAALRFRGLQPQLHDLNRPLDPAFRLRGDAAVVLLNGTHTPQIAERANAVIDLLQAAHVSTLIWGAADEELHTSDGLVEQLEETTSADEVLGRLTMLARYGPQLARLETEINHLQRVGNQLRTYFEEVEHDMSLAGRLQRSFLPEEGGRLPGVEFDFLYRPASWVSGDIFDIFRINESHIGLFVADVMGHGTAAGLITMFLRRALAPKRLTPDGYEIVSPTEVLTQLHQALAGQCLPGAQFVTAAYATLDTHARILRLARGGHPHPLLLRSGCAPTELRTEGGLMGIADLDPEFNEVETRLAVGDQLLLFTDGIEDFLIQARANPDDPPPLFPDVQELLKSGGRRFPERFGDLLYHRAGSIKPSDDMTLIHIRITE